MRDLSSCVFQKFGGYEILKHQLIDQEKQLKKPIDKMYESVNDESAIA